MLFKMLPNIIPLALLTISLTSAGTINSTRSDSDTEYYIGNTSNEFEAGYILCSGDKPNCHIQCNQEYTCTDATINATFAQHLLLECSDQYACQSITVYGPNTSVGIQCMARYACRFGLFELTDTNTVNMNCDGGDQYTSTYACYSSTVNAAVAEDFDIQCRTRTSCQNAEFNGTFVANSIDVLCNEYQACLGLTLYGLESNQVNFVCNDSVSHSTCGGDVYCPSNRANQCNFDCGGERCGASIYVHDNFTIGYLSIAMDSCSPTIQGCAQFSSNCIESGLSSSYYYSIFANESRCTSYGCCPMTHFELDLNCNDGEDCVIDCNQNDPFGIGCKSMYPIIDASNANSLTLQCVDGGICSFSSVLCPMNGNCTIHCDGAGACSFLTVNASSSRNTKIICGTGTDVCRALDVYALDNQKVDMLCNGDCGGSWYFTNAESVDIVFNGVNDRGADIYAQDTNRTTIVCNATSACTLAVEAMGAQSVNIDCVAPESCQSIHVWCPLTDNSCNIHCSDTNSSVGSCSRLDIHFDGWDILTPSSNILNLECPLSEYDCTDVDFYCTQYYDRYAAQKDTSLAYYPNLEQFACDTGDLSALSNRDTCCPFFPEILCAADEDCYVNCNDSALLCANAVINGKNAASLTVLCEENTCAGTQFECPLKSGSMCSVRCGGNTRGVCRSSSFYSNGATQIELMMNAPLAARYMSIDISSDNNTVNLNCSMGCDDVEFSNDGQNGVSNIYCNECSSSAFNFNNSDRVVVVCSDTYSCAHSYLSAKSKEIIVTCDASNSCNRFHMDLRETEQMTLNANANDTFGTNTGLATLVQPPTHAVNVSHLNCGVSRGCYALKLWLQDDGYVDGYLDVSCDDTNGCADIAVECRIGYGWGNTQLLSTTDDYYCDPSSNDCCPFGNGNDSDTQSTSAAPQPFESPTSAPTVAGDASTTRESVPTTGGTSVVLSTHEMDDTDATNIRNDDDAFNILPSSKLVRSIIGFILLTFLQ